MDTLAVLALAGVGYFLWKSESVKVKADSGRGSSGAIVEPQTGLPIGLSWMIGNPPPGYISGKRQYPGTMVLAQESEYPIVGSVKHVQSMADLAMDADTDITETPSELVQRRRTPLFGQISDGIFPLNESSGSRSDRLKTPGQRMPGKDLVINLNLQNGSFNDQRV